MFPQQASPSTCRALLLRAGNAFLPTSAPITGEVQGVLFCIRFFCYSFSRTKPRMSRLGLAGRAGCSHCMEAVRTAEERHFCPISSASWKTQPSDSLPAASLLHDIKVDLKDTVVMLLQCRWHRLQLPTALRSLLLELESRHAARGGFLTPGFSGLSSPDPCDKADICG